jgi:hypothetical protein
VGAAEPEWNGVPGMVWGPGGRDPGLLELVQRSELADRSNRRSSRSVSSYAGAYPASSKGLRCCSGTSSASARRTTISRPGTERRRALITQLWAPDGEHVLVPPEAVRELAAGIKLSSTFEVRGHRELEDRIADAYEHFIASGQYEFRLRDEPQRLRDVIKFR